MKGKKADVAIFFAVFAFLFIFGGAVGIWSGLSVGSSDRVFIGGVAFVMGIVIGKLAMGSQ